MSDLKIWAAGICLSVLGTVLLEMLVPAGEMKKLFSFLLSVTLLLLILNPILEIPNKIDEFNTQKQQRQDDTDTQALSDYVDQQMMQAVQDNLENLAGEKLSQENLPYKKLSAITDIDEDGSILIIKLVVECDDLYGDKIRDVLSKTFKLQTEVITDGT